MRRVLAALLLLPGLAHAQSAGEGSRRPDMPREQPGFAVLPPIGLPLPAIGLPLPPIGLPPLATSTVSPAASPAQGAPHRGDRRRWRSSPPSIVYVMPAYGWFGGVSTASAATLPVAAASTGDAPAPPLPPSRFGTLTLELQPRVSGQLFVDGVYVGTLDELGADLALAPGTRRLEIQLAGYAPLALAVRIEDGRQLLYRGAFVPVADAGTATPASNAPRDGTAGPPPSPVLPPSAGTPPRKPLFYIPGCYLGDVPPRDAGLPPTCDVSRAVIFRP